MRDRIGAFFENYYPVGFAGIGLFIFYNLDYEVIQSADGFVNAIISFSSILIGFLGVVIALLYSIKQENFLKLILKNRYYKKKLQKYCNTALFSGFIVVIFSLMMLGKMTIKLNGPHIIFEILEMIKYAEVFSLIYFIMASFRVIRFILKCVFLNGVEEDDYNLREASRSDIEMIRKKYGRD